MGEPITVLTHVEEYILENFILASYKKGFQVHKNNILDSFE